MLGNLGMEQLRTLGAVVSHAQRVYGHLGPSGKKELARLLVAVANLLAKAAEEVMRDGANSRED